MGKKILVIDGHPDPDPVRFCHALAAAYAEAARSAGHAVEIINLSAVDVPLLRTRREWENEQPPPTIGAAQDRIRWAEHLVIIYPLWLGAMPALLKGFFEQVFRPGFAIDAGKRTLMPGKLTGKSARVLVTMGMPAFVYRWYFMAHSLMSLERNILRFVGLKPIRHSIIGSVEASAAAREKWLLRVRQFAREAI
jgi:putative NADPH-quinone reductase